MRGIAFLISLLVGAWGIKMAKIYRTTSQSVTSSTLKWVSVSEGGPIPADAVHVVDGGPYWCLLEKGISVAVPGAVVGTKCIAPFYTVRESSDFEVLVSINGSSRLVRQNWDFQEAIPTNAVATPMMLMAYIEDDDDILVGYVDPQSVSKRANFAKDGEVITKTKGVILTEVEPINYQFDHINLTVIDSDLEEENYGTYYLENPDSSSKVLNQEIKYLVTHQVYWGTGQGCIRGLNTTVATPGETYQIKWGQLSNFEKTHEHLLEKDLPPNSYVNITVFGIFQLVSEASYTGNLTSIYRELSPLSRSIAGRSYTTRKFVELRANFSRIFSLTDDVPLKDSIPKSEILIQSTTTPLPIDGGTLPVKDKTNKANAFHPAAILLTYSIAMLRSVH